jgi:hypothetical protein
MGAMLTEIHFATSLFKPAQSLMSQPCKRKVKVSVYGFLEKMDLCYMIHQFHSMIAATDQAVV